MFRFASNERARVNPVAGRRRGAFLLLTGQWTRYALQLGSLAILSRLLDPNDFGLLAMVTAVIGIATVLGDFGLSLAAIRASELSHGQRSNLFWVNTGLGVIMTVGTAALGPLLAALYGEPRLSMIAAALSLTFLLNGASVQFRVEINRNGQYGRLAFIDVIGQGVALILSVLAALCGLGYWALVVQALAVAAGGFVAAVAYTPWRPAGWQRGSDIRGMTRFGTFTAIAQVVNFVSSNIGAVMLGVVGTPATLGYYNRAFQLSTLPVQQVASPLTRIILPTLSRSADRLSEFASMVERAQKTLAYLLVGALSFVIGLASQLVPLILGGGWGGAVPFVQVLCVGAVFQALGYSYYWAALARDRPRLLLLSETPGRLLTIVGALFLVPSCPMAAAATLSVGSFVIWMTSTCFVAPRLGLGRWRMFAAAARAVFIYGAASCAALIAVGQLPVSGLWAQLLLGVGAWGATVAMFILLPVVRRDLGEVLSTVRRR